MIKKPQELSAEGKKFSMILYGEPGIGKTTLALSAPNPILCDFDRGVLRVRAEHRKTTVEVSNYDEFLTDIGSAEFKSYETIVVDTAGSMVSMMYAKYDKELNTRDPRKIYGAIKSEFSRLTGQIRDVLSKHAIYVFHSTETEKDGEVVSRLLCEGSSKDIVWAPCDFGGRIYKRTSKDGGIKRYVNFSSDGKALAKGCHGIHGEWEIPELPAGSENNFIKRLIQRAQDNISAENEAFSEAKEKYKTAIEAGTEIVAGITDLETANQSMPKIKAIDHALTSEKEIGSMFKKKVKGLGLFYDHVLGKYTIAPPEGQK